VDNWFYRDRMGWCGLNRSGSRVGISGGLL
jgi:hypothetical protein